MATQFKGVQALENAVGFLSPTTYPVAIVGTISFGDIFSGRIHYLPTPYLLPRTIPTGIG